MPRRGIVASLIGALLAVAGLGTGEQMSTPARSLQRLKADLSAGLVAKVRIVSVPYDVLTRVSLTPELLTKTAHYDHLFEMSSGMRDSLIAAIDRESVSPGDGPQDVRWGATFLNGEGSESHSVFLSGKTNAGAGRRGLIDGNPAQLSGALAEWFEKTSGAPQSKGP